MNDIIALNLAQNLAVERGIECFQDSRDLEEYVVSGLAGTGKTVALIELVRRLKAAGHRPAVCAPTGKAAHVISGKQDVFNARTLHSVLTENPVDHLKEINIRIADMITEIDEYPDRAPEIEVMIADLVETAERFKNKSSMSFEPIDPEDFHMLYDCLVIDEASMIGMNTMKKPFIDPIDCPKFFFGDHGQLPPIKDVPGVNLKDADVELTEVHRQAADSGIIHIAHHVRHTNRVDIEAFEKFPDLVAEEQDDLKTIAKYGEDHQVIVWKNATRHALNPLIRLKRGFNFMALEDHADRLRPMIGEELLFDQNDKKHGFLKGQPFRVVDLEPTDDYKRRFKDNPYLTNAVIEVERSAGDVEKIELVLSLKDLIPPHVQLRNTEKADYYMRMSSEREGIMCMYPYALTVHKSQGSEWEKVCLVGEYPQSMDKFAEWFYTAVTRASKSLVVCSPSYFRKPRKKRTIAEIRAAKTKAIA